MRQAAAACRAAIPAAPSWRRSAARVCASSSTCHRRCGPPSRTGSSPPSRIHGTQHRLERRRQPHWRRAAHAGAGARRSESDKRLGQPHRLGHRSTAVHRARDEAARDGSPICPLLLGGKALQQPLRHHQAEHAVADELQPLVGAQRFLAGHFMIIEARAAGKRPGPALTRASSIRTLGDRCRAMRQRLAQQLRPAESPTASVSRCTRGRRSTRRPRRMTNLASRCSAHKCSAAGSSGSPNGQSHTCPDRIVRSSTEKKISTWPCPPGWSIGTKPRSSGSAAREAAVGAVVAVVAHGEELARRHHIVRRCRCTGPSSVVSLRICVRHRPRMIGNGGAARRQLLVEAARPGSRVPCSSDRDV